MLFSLIVPTINRLNELDLFLNSCISNRKFILEIIIIDQNKSSFLECIIEKYKSQLPIHYIKSNIMKLSYNRNIALNIVKGNIVCFPDDDCKFSEKLLYNINKKFDKNKDLDFLSISVRDENTKELLSYTPLSSEIFIETYNIFDTVTSVGLFIRNNSLPRFDEDFGIGGKYNSSEEMDYVFRLLKLKKKGKYFPDLYIYHPPLKEDKTEKFFQKIKKNSFGHGALARKHLTFSYKYFFYFFSKVLIRPIVGLIYSLLIFDVFEIKKYLLIVLNRTKGFIFYKK